MGKKTMAHKQASAKPPSTLREENPGVQPLEEARPPSPQPQQQTPTPQATPMVSLDELTAFLKQRNPNMDWEATLTGFGQIGGGTSVAGRMSAIPTPTLEIPTTVNPLTTVPTSSTPMTEGSSPKEIAPSATSKPSPKQPQIEPLAASPLSAYQDPYQEEDKEGRQEAEEKESEGGGGRLEETPVAKPRTGRRKERGSRSE